ncbi:MAG: hypothetical protein OXH96_06935 [Spirochaetaceae bacterium]|nr:hypothetical protein [Spirochaetaceae bacterium]
MTATVRPRLPAAAILFAVAVALVGGVAGAQAIDTDEESLFGSPDEDDHGTQESLDAADPFGSPDREDESVGDSSIDTSDLFDSDLFEGEVPATEPGTAGAAAAPPPPPVEIGGAYRFSLTGEAHWASPAELADEPLQPDSHRATVDLGATVFLDARPADDFRVFGKVDLSYPFSTDADAQPAREFDDVVKVKELFSDFSVGDALFLRGGKHTIAWGVGYFFSPADVLNLTAIDPEDPDAEREGPVSLRANLPIDFHNLYLYAIADPIEGGVQLAAAPKAEVVLDGAEVGIGAYFHPERVPRAMLTLTTSLLDFDLFAELEGSLGSDRRFVQRAARGTGNAFGLRTARNTEDPFAAATAGLRYTYAPAEEDWSATLAGQYLWNGEGYADPAVLRDNRAGVAALLAAGDLSGADLAFRGRHYAAASLNVALGRGADWSAGVLWLSNLSDGSARIAPSVTFRPLDHLSLRAAATVTYGEEGAEMTPLGPRVGASLTATLGSGRF